MEEIAAYDEEEEAMLQLDIEDGEAWEREQELLEAMSEEEREAYKEKKFDETLQQMLADADKREKREQERGYSFVKKKENGKNVFVYQQAPLIANNKTIFDLRQASLTYRKKIRAERAELEVASTINEEVIKHKLLLDTKEYNSKPKSQEAGAIQNRLPKCAVDITIEDLAIALVSGRTFKPNYMTGKSQDTFVSSSLIAIDVDNKGEELAKYGYVSIESFMKKTLKAKYKPCIIYTTFSNTDKCNKYRAIFQLDRVVTNLMELRAIATEIKTEYPFSDAKVSPTHLIYGGRELVLLNPNSLVSMPEMNFEEVKTTEVKTTEIKKVLDEKKNINEEMLINNLSSLREKFEGKTIDVFNSFEWINKNIPMTIALGYDIDTRFRCILPGHLDNHPSARISETVEGQQNYICSCGHTYKSLIDIVSELLNKNKVIVQQIIADAVGIKIGSTYQKEMRLLIADIIANTDKVIKKDTVLYNYMSRSNLHGLYNLIQQFASSHITEYPLGASDKITFFMSQSQIKEKMIQFQMKGADRIGYKLNALKEIGLIRALPDGEINVDALAKAKDIQNKMTLDNPRAVKYMKRIEYYELCLITPKEIKRAEDILQKQKELGVKRSNINSTRRALAMGEEFVSNINVQMNVAAKLNSPKLQKELDKVVAAAHKILIEQKYFTEEQLRKAYDPNRKKRKEASIKIINDALPLIIKKFNLQKNRVKKTTKILYSIPDSIKTNTTIYVSM